MRRRGAVEVTVAGPAVAVTGTKAVEAQAGSDNAAGELGPHRLQPEAVLGAGLQIADRSLFQGAVAPR